MSKIGNYSAIGYPIDGGHEAVTTSGTSAASSAAGAHVHRVVLEAPTEDVHINFGAAATVNDFRLTTTAGPVMFIIHPGQTVNGIQPTGGAGGTLYVNFMDA